MNMEEARKLLAKVHEWGWAATGSESVLVEACEWLLAENERLEAQLAAAQAAVAIPVRNRTSEYPTFIKEDWHREPEVQQPLNPGEVYTVTEYRCPKKKESS